MPIRIDKDNDDSASPDNFPGNDNSGGGGGGKMPGGNILAILLGLLLKNPKLALIVLLLGGGYYFFAGNGGCGNSGTITQQVQQLFATGASFDPEQYDKMEVFEPLADNVRNPLPEKVSLEQYAPPRQNQGQQGSCVGWGSGYAARSILQSRASGIPPEQTAFSPAFLYNQIHLSGCQGSYIEKAMDNMLRVGALPYDQFPYSDEDCSRMPDGSQMQDASQYRIKGSQRLTKSGDDYKVDMLAIKQNLAQGAPVVVGMMVGGSFMQGMLGKKVWIPEREDYNMSGFGGHCMCVIGYDDYLEGGAFQIMNSWGDEWGENGIGWIRYRDFDFFTKEAYGLYPMGDGKKFDPDELDVAIGLVSNETNKNIPLRSDGNGVFTTVTPMRVNEHFKLEATNNVECYTYVFGQETDGSSYILFPYTPKHSPYCGITGTRLFPRDYSLRPDSIGTQDVMAVVITKKPVDYKALNDKINRTTSGGMEERIRNALGTELVGDARFNDANGRAVLATPLNGANAVAVVIRVSKQ